MVACPACGADNPAGSRFCNSCGSPLAAPAALVSGERKVVTALFCDLVGFTATSESADPEDVDRMLTAYFAMARSQIEAHGGVVEKFIGDAVVGRLRGPGGPRGRSRAGRPGGPPDLRGRRAAPGPRRRAAPPPGRASTPGRPSSAWASSPGSGERFLAGDADQHRLAHPVGRPGDGRRGRPRRPTRPRRQVFDYAELEPATLKGKTEPVRVFHAVGSRGPASASISPGPTTARTSVARSTSRSSRALFDKTVAASIGPARRPWSASRASARAGSSPSSARTSTSGPMLVTWRQGRCLPYGEGITFWALGEVVKAQAGHPRVGPGRGRHGASSMRSCPRVPSVPGSASGCFRCSGSRPARRPSVTSSSRPGVCSWSTLPTDRPTVLVFEDLHWADEAMLAFLEHLAERAEGVPLLVIGTARPGAARAPSGLCRRDSATRTRST